MEVFGCEIQSSPPQGKLGQGRVSQFPESTSWDVEGFAYKNCTRADSGYVQLVVQIERAESVHFKVKQNSIGTK